MIRVILADDEAPARQLLRQYLSEFPDMLVVAECRNGLEAVEAIALHQPDLVFLDIQMPGKTGFEVLASLAVVPPIIFSTAYDSFALKAFEVNALDYLLKPYTRERFRQAVQRVRDNGGKSSTGLPRLDEQLQTRTGKSYPERLLVESGNRLINLAVGDIWWVEAYGDYTKLHSAKGVFLSTFGLGEIAERLDPEVFIRIHRSHLVALAHICEVQKDAGGYTVILPDGAGAKVSRSYADALKRFWV